MEVDGEPSRRAEVQSEVFDYVRAAHSKSLEWGVIPRLDFYQRARGAFAIVHTLESRPWGCFIFQKGVVFPSEGNP